MELKSKKDFIENIQPGNIVAFKIEDDMYSGKVIGICEYGFTVKTKNGSVYYPTRDDIAWVKNGSHWPVGIYNALKLSKTK